MRLRIVAGTDVAAPAESIPPAGSPLGELLDLIEPLYDLFGRHKQAQTNYRRAVAEIAKRTGHSISSIGHIISAGRQKRSKSFEPEDWSNLM